MKRIAGNILFISILFIISYAKERTDNPNPIVGAIRWDAYYGSQDDVGQSINKRLSPQKWHNRLPFYAKEIGKDSIQLNGSAQSVIDQEITYAKNAGLDYWAFVTYEPSAYMSLSLKSYLASSLRSQINFCLVTECHRWEDTNYVAWLVNLIKQPGYQVVLNNRPIIFLSFITQQIIDKYFYDIRGLGKLLSDFRVKVKNSGLNDPYIIIMDTNPPNGKRWIDLLDCQALSSYEINCNEEKGSYANLAKCAETFWEKCKETNAQVVPIIMSGWDRRPRIENPIKWEKWQKPGVGIDYYYEATTSIELYDHVKSALNWLDLNKASAQANLALIYAWNEIEEGGYIVPTLKEGTMRLDAVSKALKNKN